MERMLVLDLDGTLTNSEKKLTGRTRKRLLRAMDEGMLLALASGRSPNGILHIAQELEMEKRGGYMIAFNGSCIEELKSGRRLKEEFVDRKYYSEILALGKEFGADILTYGREQKSLVSNNASNPYARLDAVINRMELRERRDLHAALDYPVPKFLFLGEGDRMERVEGELKQRIGDRLEVYRSEPYFLEIMPKGIDKGNALRALCESIGLPIGRTIAFGDGYNDLGMIEAAGLGVAMGNAVSRIKEAADYITSSNDEDGVAEALDRLIGRQERK